MTAVVQAGDCDELPRLIRVAPLKTVALKEFEVYLKRILEIEITERHNLKETQDFQSLHHDDMVCLKHPL